MLLCVILKERCQRRVALTSHKSNEVQLAMGFLQRWGSLSLIIPKVQAANPLEARAILKSDNHTCRLESFRMSS